MARTLYGLLGPITIILGTVAGTGTVAESREDTLTITTRGVPPKTFKGEAVRQNLKGLQLKGADGPVSLAWSEVETVDGRPVREHVERLKEGFKDVLCPDCRGGLVAVLGPECLGPGKICRKTRIRPPLVPPARPGSSRVLLVRGAVSSIPRSRPGHRGLPGSPRSGRRS